MSKTAEINFKITLDENNVPLNIEWRATDSANKEIRPCKSVMISLWDPKEKNSLRIDLWTKDMQVDEMNIHFFQTLITMAETFEKATGNKEILADMKSFCNDFSRKVDLFKERQKEKK